jgi:2-methylfumaryl-CoA hydratase
VLDKIELGVSHVGALRLRMIGIKDATAASIVFPDAGQSRPAYPSNVVLDLDYTIVIPRKS